MPQKLLSDNDFRAAAKAGQQPEGTLFKFATTEAEQVGDEDARTQRFVFSDATVDHSGDSIDPKGWDLSVFNSNPVALFSHLSWDPPIGKASNVSVVGSKLMGDIEFAAAEVYEFADTVYRLVKGKFLKAVSVGFLPKEWTFTGDKDRPYGIDFVKQLLLEISVCPIPCNPNALGEARSVGIDTRGLVDWAEKVLDSGDTAFMPRKDLEALRVQAKGAEVPRFYIQADRALSKDARERLVEAFDAWRENPEKTLVLEKGLTLHPFPATKAEDWKCGAARDLPLDKDGDWDGPAAEASIFEHAGGDDFDPAIARTGFLAYDASAPKLRGSYKLPFAHVVDGELRAMASGVRAAASRLPQTEIPEGVQETAREILDHYEAELGDKSATGVTKAGRRISAATRSTLDKAMEHHAAMGECIRELMDGDGSVEPPQDEDDPPAPVVEPEADDELEDLSPEAKRVKEARALKASLPTND